MLTPSEAASEVLLVLSVFLLAIAFLVQSRPGIRILLGTVLMLTVAGSIEAFAPTGWESQIIAFVVVSTLLVLMAWQVPRGPYRSTLFLVAALMGFLGLGTGAYAIAAGSLTAIAAALLSAAYLGVVWAAWTGRLRPVEIPPLHPRM